MALNDTINQTMNITLNYTQMYLEQLQRANNTQTGMILFIIIGILTITGFVLYHKKNKQRKEEIKKQAQILKETTEAYDKLEREIPNLRDNIHMK